MSDETRRDAVGCALAAIAAVDPARLVTAALRARPIRGRIHLLAIGKAAVPMARAALECVSGDVVRAIIISPVVSDIGDARVEGFVGGHPIPSEQGARGASAARELVTSLGESDELLCFVSGGASALATLPAHGLTLTDVAETTNLLLRSGATIDELNCVRKHVDALKGGRLAAIAYPARVTTLVLSDVIGDSLTTIASGPTVGDPTSTSDAVAILRVRGVWDAVPERVRVHLDSGDAESPKPGDPRLARSDTVIIGNNVTAAAAAAAYAESSGYRARVVTTALAGEARIVGGDIVDMARAECAASGAPVALVIAGETTVTVRGNGRGGRNQELALSAALDATQPGIPVTVASIGTDGIDGPTDAAGAVIDEASLAGVGMVELARAALAGNDSYGYFVRHGGLVITGPTGTNVMDIVIAIATPTA